MHSQIILSTAYFPPITYFAYLLKSQQAYIEIHETYPKQTFRNRCQIYESNGKLDLSLPVNKPNGNHTKTNEILISDQSNWGINHWRAIESAYNSSPFFLYYQDELKPIFLSNNTNLTEHNKLILNTLLEVIEINIKPKETSEYKKLYEDATDLRSALSPKKPIESLNFPEYFQVFNERHGFIQNLSILDLLFNEGPASKQYLEEIAKQII